MTKKREKNVVIGACKTGGASKEWIFVKFENWCQKVTKRKKVVRNFARRIENTFKGLIWKKIEGIQEPCWPRASNSLCTPLNRRKPITISESDWEYLAYSSRAAIWLPKREFTKWLIIATCDHLRPNCQSGPLNTNRLHLYHNLILNLCLLYTDVWFAIKAINSYLCKIHIKYTNKQGMGRKGVGTAFPLKKAPSAYMRSDFCNYASMFLAPGYNCNWIVLA